MPSSSPRPRVPVRRSPRPAPRAADVRTPSRERPPAVTFTAVFGLLLTVEVLYLGYLLWQPAPSVDRFLVLPLMMAALSVVGTVLVLTGKRWGWVVLAVAAVLPLAALLVFVFLLGALGGGAQLWAGVLLLVGPLTTLVLTLRRPVREWCGSRPVRRPAEVGRGGRLAR